MIQQHTAASPPQTLSRLHAGIRRWIQYASALSSLVCQEKHVYQSCHIELIGQSQEKEVLNGIKQNSEQHCHSFSQVQPRQVFLLRQTHFNVPIMKREQSVKKKRKHKNYLGTKANMVPLIPTLERLKEASLSYMVSSRTAWTIE